MEQASSKTKSEADFPVIPGTPEHPGISVDHDTVDREIDRELEILDSAPKRPSIGPPASAVIAEPFRAPPELTERVTSKYITQLLADKISTVEDRKKLRDLVYPFVRDQLIAAEDFLASLHFRKPLMDLPQAKPAGQGAAGKSASERRNVDNKLSKDDMKDVGDLMEVPAPQEWLNRKERREATAKAKSQAAPAAKRRREPEDYEDGQSHRPAKKARWGSRKRDDESYSDDDKCPRSNKPTGHFKGYGRGSNKGHYYSQKGSKNARGGRR